jgi:CRISPR associated protein Cas1
MKQILNTLYVQTQGTYLQLDHETLKVKVEEETKQVPLHHLGSIMAFGNVLFSPFLIHRCAAESVAGDRRLCGEGLFWGFWRDDSHEPRGV